MALTPVQTVGELADVLAKLPRDMRLYQRGSMGDWTPSVVVGTKLLMKHKNPEENYVADSADPVWRNKKTVFEPAFTAVIID